MVDELQIASGIIGFAPALALFYFTLKPYTFPSVEKPYFDDRKAFLFFGLGIVLGMVIYAFESWGGSVSSSQTFLLLILGFAVFQELMKLVILNFPRFQRKVDTPFYGVALGLGIGATFTFAVVYTYFLGLEDPELIDYLPAAFLGFLFVLLHVSTTTLIGIGVARGDLKGYVSEAILIHLIFSLMYETFFVVAIVTYPLNYIGLIGATAVVVWAYRKVYTVSLPALIYDAKKLFKQKKEKTAT